MPITERRKKMPLVKKPNEYTDEQRRAAVAAYQVLGTFKAVAEQLGLNKWTVRNWHKSEWWPEVARQVKQEADDQIVAKFTRVVNTALDGIEDRLVNGDERLVKTKEGHESVRVKMSGRDCALVAGVSTDKRQILTHQPTSIKGEAEGMESLLKKFEALARSSREKVVSDQ